MDWFVFVDSPFYVKLTCTNETIAEVVHIERVTDSDGTAYLPIFSYNVNGEQIIVRHDTAMNPSPYSIGDTFTLFYNPNKPESYYIEGFAGGNWIRILAGLVVIGVFILYVTGRLKRV